MELKRGRGLFDAQSLFNRDYASFSPEALEREVIQIRWVMRCLKWAGEMLSDAVLEFWREGREPLEQIRVQLWEFEASVDKLYGLVCDESNRRARAKAEESDEQ